MSTEFLAFRRFFLCFAAIAGVAAAALPVCNAQSHVEVVSTEMNHVSVIQIPEIVDNVAVGSSYVHVEWYGKTVLIRPTHADVDTNMVVFTPRTTYLYEITPAAAATGQDLLLKEPTPPPPPPRPTPSPMQVRSERDREFVNLLMTTRPLNTKDIRNRKRTVIIRVVEVSHDEDNYYVRLNAVNELKSTYRLQNPKVVKLDPAFGADKAYELVGRQLDSKIFNAFHSTVQVDYSVYASTLDHVDMPPDSTMTWVIAIPKPAVTPGIYEFDFPSYQKGVVHAIAIF